MSHRPRSVARPRSVSGFTLLELIVVVFIFAIVGLLAYGGLDYLMRARSAIEASTARTQAYVKAYVRLRDDFQQLRQRPVRDGYGDWQPTFRATDKGLVSFTRAGWSNPLLLPRSTLERVRYELDGDQLQRTSWRALDIVEDSKPVHVTLLSGVSEARWRFLDNDKQWWDEWPRRQDSGTSTEQITTPMAVELTLVTTDWGELRFLFRNALGEYPEQFLSPGGSTASSPAGDPGIASEQDSDSDSDSGDSSDSEDDGGGMPGGPESNGDPPE